MPICLSLDSLFAGGPTMSICEKNNWKFMIVHKEGDIPFVHKEFESLLPLTPENHFTFLTGPQGKTRQEYRWINDISYTDSEKKKHTVAVLECVENKPIQAAQPDQDHALQLDHQFHPQGQASHRVSQPRRTYTLENRE